MKRLKINEIRPQRTIEGMIEARGLLGVVGSFFGAADQTS